MNGIHGCFTGRLGKDAEVRTTRDGKPWASFSVVWTSVVVCTRVRDRVRSSRLQRGHNRQVVFATECLGFARPVKKVTDETPVVLARHAWVMSADSRGAITWRGPERPR
jgi:hypothetical protein